MAGPLIILYGISILIVKMVNPAEDEEDADEEDADEESATKAIQIEESK